MPCDFPRRLARDSCHGLGPRCLRFVDVLWAVCQQIVLAELNTGRLGAPPRADDSGARPCSRWLQFVDDLRRRANTFRVQNGGQNVFMSAIGPRRLQFVDVLWRGVSSFPMWNFMQDVFVHHLESMTKTFVFAIRARGACISLFVLHSQCNLSGKLVLQARSL